MDKFNYLHTFMLVAETGSFVSAAKSLGIDPSTISKSINVLEESLGISLFQRTTRRMNITQSGEAYYAHVKHMLESLDACEDRLQKDISIPTGVLKVNLPVSYGRTYVLPHIRAFCEQYPDIRVDLNFDDAYVDIIEQGFDVSIRTGVLQEQRMVARQLSSMDFVTCATPGYLLKHGIKRLTTSNMKKLPWVRFRFKQSGKLMPIFSVKNDAVVEHDVGQEYIVDDGEALAELCAASAGLSQFPHFVARSYLQSGRLVPVSKVFSHPKMGVYLMYPNREHLPERVRVFADFLRKKLEQIGEGPEGTWALKLGVGAAE